MWLGSGWVCGYGGGGWGGACVDVQGCGFGVCGWGGSYVCVGAVGACGGMVEGGGGSVWGAVGVCGDMVGCVEYGSMWVWVCVRVQ